MRQMHMSSKSGQPGRVSSKAVARAQCWAHCSHCTALHITGRPDRRVQVGQRGVKALAATRTPMSMDGILDVLVEKARVEAEDAQRVLLAALNGLAGIFLLESRPADGIALYRQVWF